MKYGSIELLVLGGDFMTGIFGVDGDFMTRMVMCARTPFFLTTVISLDIFYDIA